MRRMLMWKRREGSWSLVWALIQGLYVPVWPCDQAGLKGPGLTRLLIRAQDRPHSTGLRHGSARTILIRVRGNDPRHIMGGISGEQLPGCVRTWGYLLSTLDQILDKSVTVLLRNLWVTETWKLLLILPDVCLHCWINRSCWLRPLVNQSGIASYLLGKQNASTWFLTCHKYWAKQTPRCCLTNILSLYA